jgi:hypothetical protein
MNSVTRETKAILGGVAAFIILVGLAFVFQMLVMQMVAAAARSGGEIAFWKRLAITASLVLSRYQLLLLPAGLAGCILGSLFVAGRRAKDAAV